MPWSSDSGPARHSKKANTPAKKQKWASVANDVLERTGDEGRAVRAANAVVKRGPARPKSNVRRTGL